MQHEARGAPCDGSHRQRARLPWLKKGRGGHTPISNPRQSRRPVRGAGGVSGRCATLPDKLSRGKVGNAPCAAGMPLVRGEVVPSRAKQNLEGAGRPVNLPVAGKAACKWSLLPISRCGRAQQWQSQWRCQGQALERDAFDVAHPGIHWRLILSIPSRSDLAACSEWFNA